MSFSKGLTIIELMITVFIIGVVAAVGVPSLQSLISGRSGEQMVGELATDFRFARSSAVTDQTNTTLTITAGGLGWTVVQGGTTLRRKAFNDDGSKITTSAGPYTFNANGMMNGTANITLTIANCTQQLVVNRIGQVINRGGLTCN